LTKGWFLWDDAKNTPNINIVIIAEKIMLFVLYFDKFTKTSQF